MSDTVPDYQTLMLPALRRLGAQRWRTAELIGALSDEFRLTPEQRAELLPSGRQPKIANRTHWAITYLTKAGLLTRVGRGEYEASPEGQELLKTPPERITLPFLLKHYRALRAFREAAAPDTSETIGAPVPVSPIETATPDDVVDQAVAEIDLKVRAELDVLP